MSLELALRVIGGVLTGLGAWDVTSSVEAYRGSSVEAWAVVTVVAASFGIGFLLTPYFTTRPFFWLLETVTHAPTSDVVVGSVGLLLGLLTGTLLMAPLQGLPGPLRAVAPITVSVLGAYFGIRTALGHKRDLLALLGTSWGSGGGATPRPSSRALLDTSAIIDGRIADIARSGFLAGTLLVPRFILGELQRVADSPDPVRRARGRRGLEILTRLQQDPAVELEVSEEDGDTLATVDAQLVAVARTLQVPIVTNDYNLNRVASLQGVKVLNVNELANAVRAVVLPGEEITIRITQEGREYGQGVGYLEDGTMVVVENGRPMLNSAAEVAVTRVLQTAAGRMIFAQLKPGHTETAQRA